MISYLLGDLPEEHKRGLEEKYSIDDQLYEELQAAERDLIDSYVEGELSERERELFETYFLSSPARRQRLRFATAFKEYNAPAPAGGRGSAGRVPFRAGFFATPSWKYVIPAILILVLAPAVFWRSFYQSDVSEGLEAFKKAYGQRRPSEFRISGLGYAPASKTRGDNRSGVDDTSRRRAEVILRGAVDEDPGPESRHALGQVYLASGDFDGAIREFEIALSEAPKNARLHSDLGAALLAKGTLDLSRDEPPGASAELARSLESLTRALELDDSLPEAIFNLALVYEAMKRPEEAREAWQRYLEKDRHSGWAEEAEERLRRMPEEKKKTSKETGRRPPDLQTLASVRPRWSWYLPPRSL